MWEIFTCGDMPYGRTKNADVIDLVCHQNFRLPQPAHCVDSVYGLMEECWHFVRIVQRCTLLWLLTLSLSVSYLVPAVCNSLLPEYLKRLITISWCFQFAISKHILVCSLLIFLRLCSMIGTLWLLCCTSFIIVTIFFKFSLACNGWHFLPSTASVLYYCWPACVSGQCHWDRATALSSTYLADVWISVFL